MYCVVNTRDVVRPTLAFVRPHTLFYLGCSSVLSHTHAWWRCHLAAHCLDTFRVFKTLAHHHLPTTTLPTTTCPPCAGVGCHARLRRPAAWLAGGAAGRTGGSVRVGGACRVCVCVCVCVKKRNESPRVCVCVWAGGGACRTPLCRTRRCGGTWGLVARGVWWVRHAMGSSAAAPPCIRHVSVRVLSHHTPQRAAHHKQHTLCPRPTPSHPLPPPTSTVPNVSTLHLIMNVTPHPPRLPSPPLPHTHAAASSSGCTWWRTAPPAPGPPGCRHCGRRWRRRCWAQCR